MSNKTGYTIPKDMKADVMIIGRLTLKDIIIIALFSIIGLMISNILNTGLLLKVIVIAAHLVIGLIATAKPRGNPDKSLYLVMLSMYRMDKNGYRSLDINKYNKREMR
ncbi:DUF5592 family protein [Macrococcus bovicus]|uniref:DUF5592 family protein n=1 Tax=Macrococcus bovicus TaxID=69968 RepID=UPI0025A5AC8C|nr:DUF5592 family protein [Macrococcus bovicus]WJP96729.1 DUF5592 family protein [Macrococcus bovicus]